MTGAEGRAGVPFRVGERYTRLDVQRLLGLPEPTTGGKWGTGYAREGRAFFIFANLGTSGRTGHDYANGWLPDGRMQWEAKSRTRLGQPEITAMLQPGVAIHVFWRAHNRDPFTYAGCGRATEVENRTPVRLRWAFSLPVELTASRPASPPSVVAPGPENLSTVVEYLAAHGVVTEADVARMAGRRAFRRLAQRLDEQRSSGSIAWSYVTEVVDGMTRVRKLELEP